MRHYARIGSKPVSPTRDLEADFCGTATEDTKRPEYHVTITERKWNGELQSIGIQFKDRLEDENSTLVSVTLGIHQDPENADRYKSGYPVVTILDKSGSHVRHMGPDETIYGNSLSELKGDRAAEKILQIVIDLAGRIA